MSTIVSFNKAHLGYIAGYLLFGAKAIVGEPFILFTLDLGQPLLVTPNRDRDPLVRISNSIYNKLN